MAVEKIKVAKTKTLSLQLRQYYAVKKVSFEIVAFFNQLLKNLRQSIYFVKSQVTKKIFLTNSKKKSLISAMKSFTDYKQSL